ncbi:MAG: anti-sigma-K factor RskA [Myxococcota bacterium]|jgi:anti-sigma-K factor RskA
MTPTEDNTHALAGPYALDAIDDLERVRFEVHLNQCPTCIIEVAGFLDTTALIAAVEEAVVPAGLKASVMAEIDTVRQVGPSRAIIRRPSPRLASVAAAVLAVAVVGLSVVTTGLRSEISSLSVATTDLRSEISVLEDRAVAAAVLIAQDALVLKVGFGDGALHVVASPASGTGVLLVDGVAVAPTGMGYQLWLINTEGEAIAAGFLDVHRDGTGEQLMVGDMSNIVAIGITIEPAGGSQQPTSAPVALAALSA